MRLAANERWNGIAGRVLNNAGVQLATRFRGPSENATDAEECECEGRRLHCWQGVGSIVRSDVARQKYNRYVLLQREIKDRRRR